MIRGFRIEVTGRVVLITETEDEIIWERHSNSLVINLNCW